MKQGESPGLSEDVIELKKFSLSVMVAGDGFWFVMRECTFLNFLQILLHFESEELVSV